MKKPLMVAASGLAGLTIGLAGCGDDKGDGGGGTSTFPTVTTALGQTNFLHVKEWYAQYGISNSPRAGRGI